jgi:glycosyltransferase involved in cell wall biosynthesis
MSRARITFVSHEQHLPRRAIPVDEVVPLSELKRWAASGALVRRILRYGSARYLTHDVGSSNLPFKMGVALRLVSRGACWFEDEGGRRRYVTPSYLVRRCLVFAMELAVRPLFLRSVRARVDHVSHGAPLGRRVPDPSLPPMYLRTDLDHGLVSGGSVAHTAGVLNALDRFTPSPVFVTTARMPMVRDDIETHRLVPEQRFWDFRELPKLYFNHTAIRQVESLASRRRFSFVYHRYTAHSFAAVEVAARLKLPLVLEYNGSEVWVSRNWGKPLAYEGLALRIEDLMIHSADVIVVVSQPLRDELVGRGVEPRRVVVNPNGVDPKRYSPTVNGTVVRTRLGLGNRRVIGFVGSFGKWHGAEKLIEAFAELVRRRPRWRDSTALLLVGNGVMVRDVRRIIERERLEDTCAVVGTVPQDEGASYMAACDILTSPQVPNPDGSAFFGSPTKLFEYMAMGKPIVASALGQIADTLQHEQTALLVRPGDPHDLAYSLERLLDDAQLRLRLGREARCEAVSRHTWERHVQRIVASVRELCA